MREDEFEIDSHSPEVIRHFNGEIEALKQRGEDVSYLLSNKEESLEGLAETFSKRNYEGYKHIVDLIKGLKYEPAFKAMMLRETLSKVYKIDRQDDKRKTIVKKRELKKSIAEHMILNEETLDIIYKNIGDVEKYQNFANLYFAAVAVFNKKIAEKSGIKLDGVDTYGKGRWIKFEGKTSNEEEYLKNAEELSALVQNTPWCTKELASSQLQEGDFYVFVDNTDEPHIAVKMSGNEIDEVRGVQNGNAQELEEEYRDVAISFLENNKEIKNGKEWLEKEEWNKRLIEYRRKIDEGEFTKEDLPQLIEDYFRADFRSHGGENTNKVELQKRLEKIKGKLADYYEYSEEDIHIGDIVFSGTSYKTVPYKLIFGKADFSDSQITELGQLQSIGGDAFFNRSKITDLGQLRRIGGNAYFNFSLKKLGKLQSIGGNADFTYSQVTDLGKLQSIGGNAYFYDSEVTNLSQLQSIGGDVYFGNSQITELGQLQSIGGDADFYDSEVTNLSQLQSIGGSANFSNSQITDLGELQSIGGYVLFGYSQVTDLGKLQSIGGYADFKDSQIIDLKNLIEIGGKIEWGEREDLKRQWDEIQERLKRTLDGQELGMAGLESSSNNRKEANNVFTETLGRENDRNIIGNNGED